MGRRKITDEAQEQATEENDVDEERAQFTQRMPKDLAERVEDWADDRGMSRNAAINLAVKNLVD